MVRSKARRVQVVPHDPAWVAIASQESARLQVILGEILIRIEHIGSTSVPGLAAKPIIDLMPLVTDINDVERFRGQLESAGYNWYGEYGLPGRRYLNRDDATGLVRIANIHIYAERDPEVVRHLAFRDHLRAQPALAAEYGRIKMACAALHPNDVDAYNDCKNDWIKATEQAAVDRYESGVSPSG